MYTILRPRPCHQLVGVAGACYSPLSILFSTPSIRMASPHCLHSKTCVLDKRIKPPQVGQGTSWSVLTAETRTALGSRRECSRGRCNDGKKEYSLSRGPECFQVCSGTAVLDVIFTTKLRFSVRPRRATGPEGGQASPKGRATGHR